MAASQLTSRSHTNDAFAFTGNVNVNRTYAANGLNQYSAVASTSFTYDTNGNLTSDGSNTYAYDVENRLVARSGAGTAALRYDPLGRLYELSGPITGTLRFLYEGDDLVAEYDTYGTLQRRYVHGLGGGALRQAQGDRPLVWFEGSGISDAARRYLFADERGSIVAVTDSVGNVLNVNSYDEHGIPATTNVGRFQYTGQAWLPDLGMYYYKARMYSPTLGRFMQTDPIGYGDGMNMYAYVHNDAVNGVDPTGLEIIFRTCRYSYSTTPEGYPIVSPPDCSYSGGGSSPRTPVANGRGAIRTIMGKPPAPPKPEPQQEPQSETPHKYVIKWSSLCPASTVFSYFKQAGHSAPGAPAAREGFTPRIVLSSLVPWREPNNPISQDVNSSTMTIKNKTLDGHVFFPGDVTIQVASYSNSIGSQITITGTGTGSDAQFNNAVGYAWFGSAAAEAADSCF